MEQTDKISLRKIDEVRSPFPSIGERFGWGGDAYYVRARGFLKTDGGYILHAHGRNPTNSPTHPPNLSADGAVYVLDHDMKIRDTLFSPDKVIGEGHFGLNLLSANGCLFVTSTVFRGNEPGNQYSRIHCFSESDLTYLGALDGPPSLNGFWNDGDFLFVSRGNSFEIWHSTPSDPKFGQQYSGFPFASLSGPIAPREFLVMPADQGQVGHRKYYVHRLDLPENDGLSPRFEVANPFLAFGERIGTVNQGGLLGDAWLHFSSNPAHNSNGTRDGYEHFLAPARTTSLNRIDIRHHFSNPAPDRLTDFGYRAVIMDNVFLSVCRRRNDPNGDSKMRSEVVVAFDLATTSVSEFSIALETNERIGEVALLGDSLFIGFDQRYGSFGAIDVFELQKS